VPDTLDGRFDLLALHIWLVIRHLQGEPPSGPAMAQSVFDAMFNDMDVNLREMGVGDLAVRGKVKVMWEALHGRAMAYGRALDADDDAPLRAALARNVWRGAEAGAGPARLAGIVRRQDAHLGRQRLSTGEVGFLPAAVAAEPSP
jgi:cytochrome b pre-mRNA-processing protein 3